MSAANPNSSAAASQKGAKDDWDEHWAQFSATAESGPTPKYRRRLIHKLLGVAGDGAGVRLLEIGSGTGEFAKEFCEMHPGAKYLGLELSRRGVEISRERVPAADFLQKDLLRPDAEDAFQDFAATHAVCSEVLEHLDEPATLLGNARTYLGRDCRLVVSVPGGPMNAFYRHIGHRKHYSPAEMAALLERCGFSIERTMGAGFPFFNLFRLAIGMRGQQFVEDVSGPPSFAVRAGGVIFDMLFRLNSNRSGWQTLTVARC